MAQPPLRCSGYQSPCSSRSLHIAETGLGSLWGSHQTIVLWCPLFLCIAIARHFVLCCGHTPTPTSYICALLQSQPTPTNYICALLRSQPTPTNYIKYPRGTGPLIRALLIRFSVPLLDVYQTITSLKSPKRQPSDSCGSRNESSNSLNNGWG